MEKIHVGQSTLKFFPFLEIPLSKPFSELLKVRLEVF